MRRQERMLRCRFMGNKQYLMPTATARRFVSEGRQSPVAFSFYHGEVLEVQTNQIPTVYGAGRSFLGCGRFSVQTTIVRNTAVWTRDGTGQEKRWDLGELDLPMRIGHDVSFLWANGSLYALHNHFTRQTRYLELPRSIFPFRRLWFRGFFGLLKLIFLVGLLGYVFTPLLLAFSVYPIFALAGRLDLWTARNLNPLLAAINPYMVALLVTFCVIRNWRARVANRKLEYEIQVALQDGVDAYLHLV
jgi:hypothetical protein